MGMSAEEIRKVAASEFYATRDSVQALADDPKRVVYYGAFSEAVFRLCAGAILLGEADAYYREDQKRIAISKYAAARDAFDLTMHQVRRARDR